MKKAPALPLFGDAYLADTRHLSLEEHGAYLQLLLIAWRSPDCALPDDDVRLSRMLGITAKRWAKLKPSIMAFWTLTDAGWTQKRLLKERQYVSKKSEQNSEAANARWNAKSLKTKGPNNANASAVQCERNAPSPSPKNKGSTSEVEDNLKRRAGGADAPTNSYAFFGRTVRLKPHDLERWRRTYHAIPDIDAELTAIDAWFEGQDEAKRKQWFHVTAGSLNRKHQELLALEKQAQAPPAWDGMA
jgi:uncharacterized protein YdaU (DUF1376 family)